jgi:hypothetical protein
MALYNQQVGFPNRSMGYGGSQMGYPSTFAGQGQTEWVMVQYVPN